MKVTFISLASGSSGNCYYLGTKKYGILIDAGIGVRTIKKRLKEAGISLDVIRAIFITHDHSDHIKGVGYLGEGLNIPVYATALVHKGINKNYHIRQKLCSSVRYLEKETSVRLEDFCITPFEVPHDSIDNVGYCIEIGEIVFSFLIDIGEITPVAAQYIRKANYLVVEANYDEEMLRTGSYCSRLKERIACKTGHLSNVTIADFLAENTTGILRHIWLCHLSKNNNTPELAYETIGKGLRERGFVLGRDIQLDVLKRSAVSGPYEIESGIGNFVRIPEEVCLQLALGM
ncbi:putative metallo-hydrolase YycJ [termite gut metagenome]|uniref:Putative metallo-hydrolase YycJ n=1 Tax=termite gut metagenome TaxID=433724 RepID=A0A5J4RY94_9ZZZZ